MTDYTELKRLAKAAKQWVRCDESDCTCREVHADFVDAASPDVVLGLIRELRDNISAQQTRYDILRAIVESAALPHCLEDEECKECLSCKARIVLNQIKELP